MSSMSCLNFPLKLYVLICITDLKLKFILLHWLSKKEHTNVTAVSNAIVHIQLLLVINTLLNTSLSTKNLVILSAKGETISLVEILSSQYFQPLNGNTYSRNSVEIYIKNYRGPSGILKSQS